MSEATSRSKCARGLGVVAVLAVSLFQSLVTQSAYGGTERDKVLRRLEFARAEGGVEATIHFTRPIRYVRHSPKDRGKIVRVELVQVGTAEVSEDKIRRRESLQSTIGTKSPLIEVVHESAPGRGTQLILRFRKTTEFEIRPGSRGRSVTVFMKVAASPRAPVAPPPKAAQGSSRSGQIMAEGRKAMTAAEYTRAAALYELVLSEDAPEKGKEEEGRENKRRAKELLGLARERNGQAAHARAEYEEYLELYPEGEGTGRVRQRLQALMTAEALPSPMLREYMKKDDGDQVEFFGDLSLGYYRGEDLAGEGDNSVYDSTLVADIDLTSRAEFKGYELTGELSASHDHDFAASGSQDLTRVTLLSLEVEDPTRTLGGVLGRQTRRNGGVLGRFDGLVVRGQGDDYLELSGVFGFPLESTRSAGIETDRMFLGAAADIEGYIEGATAQLFVIGQMNEELLDRFAVGAELNYVKRSGYARAFFDYDAYYNVLNLALLSASLNIGDDTQLHGSAQAQASPFFTLATALQGQSADDLDELRETYSKSEIRDLARDRTAKSYSASLGGSHWIDSELQVAADLTFDTIGSTPASGGVVADPGIDADVSTSVQVTKNNLLFSGDISSASFRFFDGETYRGYRLFLRSRIPLQRTLRIDPRISFDFRDQSQGGNDLLTIRPTVQLTWDWRDFALECEGGMDVVQYFGSNNPDPDVSGVIEILVRYEF